LELSGRLLARQRGAIIQGRTREEARENLKDAIHMMLEIIREDAEKDL
jgi:predicted RNase H-like HicB family nuclease